MINDNIILSKRPSDIIKKCFLNWILVAELVCFMKRLMTSLQNVDEREANDTVRHPFCWGLWYVL